MKWKWYVYIIKCTDLSYYIGRTWKPDQRWTQHLLGLGGKYTKEHPPKELVYMEEYEDYEEACLREKQLKGWSREKKEKLINGQRGKWG